MSHNRKDFPVTDRDADFEADRLVIDLFDGEEVDLCTVGFYGSNGVREVEGWRFTEDDSHDAQEALAKSIFDEVIANGWLNDYICRQIESAFENYDYDTED